LLARALLALRREEEAYHELSHCLRTDPRCAEAYGLLGNIALLRDEFRSAQIFLREAVRLDDKDEHAKEFLAITNHWIQPTAAVEKLPAATAAVGPLAPRESDAPLRGRRLAVGTEWQAPIGDPTSPTHAVRFGAYLVQIGAITPGQLKKALDYHERTSVRIGTATAILGFTSKQKVEWAAQAFHATPRTAR
jgi:tetratricopeptide (TPR) repeat protein